MHADLVLRMLGNRLWTGTLVCLTVLGVTRAVGLMVDRVAGRDTDAGEVTLLHPGANQSGFVARGLRPLATLNADSASRISGPPPWTCAKRVRVIIFDSLSVRASSAWGRSCCSPPASAR